MGNSSTSPGSLTQTDHREPACTNTICNTSSQKEKQQSEEQKEEVQGEHRVHNARTDHMGGWVGGDYG